MGAGASARYGEIPETLELYTGKIWAEQLGVPAEDWPEEKWAELSKGGNTITREQFIGVIEDLTLKPLIGSPVKVSAPDLGDEETFAIDGAGSGGDDEEIFAADGDFENSQDDDLGKGTFTEDDKGGCDDEDLGGMIMPGLELVANGKSGGGGRDIVAGGDELTEIGGGEEEIFAADGEAFEGSSGPGVFNEADLGIGDGSGSPVRGGGDAGAPACGDGADLAVVGSPVSGSPKHNHLKP
mmetsp:Transcript_48145/g.96944  ORF Transcript_48145/g.96944 Transcript_48145/m.96944 type:complete len:240 (-) Transcript_48145:170-889(-)|eukprot:CAMPEP_0171643404 /NCGR_PEP_ID=MMETSP0990-20121206/32653_1 /TAXON_ID=483369 /ORGANISM="non described non described, Strain CCMP2098" /LENGTH=239 /DNA_ID=CAMNT_0012219055 /DNA_START=106 /DNA_END=825 /DNA_ORIENTATION=-